MANQLELDYALVCDASDSKWGWDRNPLRLYEDLYLTEQPYGFVSGVLTDLPDND